MVLFVLWRLPLHERERGKGDKVGTPLNLAFTNVGSMIADLGKVSESAGGAQKLQPTKVEVVSAEDSVFALVKNSLTPVLGPVGEFAVVVVLVVFLLLERKRLRARFLRLIGHSRTPPQHSLSMKLDLD